MTSETPIIQPDSEQQSLSTADVTTLYKQHQPWLVRWLSGKTGCPHDAGDISQDTFLKVLNVDAEVLREPRAYLLVIANRLLINRYRRASVEKDVLQKVATLITTLENDCNHKGPADIVAARDLLSRVLLMLTDELPEKPRKAFLLAKLEGLSYREIATRLNVSESSVKQYIARVLVHCHKRFYDDLA